MQCNTVTSTLLSPSWHSWAPIKCPAFCDISLAASKSNNMFLSLAFWLPWNAFQLGIQNSEQIALLFNMRANTLNSFQMYFIFRYRVDLRCKLGWSSLHWMTCMVINDKIDMTSNLHIDEILARKEKLMNTVSEFTLRITTNYCVIFNRGQARIC